MSDGYPDVGIWQSRHSLKVLDVYEWSTENGASIVQWDLHSGNNQRWQIVMPPAARPQTPQQRPVRRIASSGRASPGTHEGWGREGHGHSTLRGPMKNRGEEVYPRPHGGIAKTNSILGPGAEPPSKIAAFGSLLSKVRQYDGSRRLLPHPCLSGVSGCAWEA